MRARTREQLAADERFKTFAANPAQMPRYFRELVRRQFAEEHLIFLHDTAMGDQKFETPVVVPGGGKDHPPRVEIVEVEAPSAIRVKAAEAMLNIAIPRQAGLVDDDGNSQVGVVLMPPLAADGALTGDDEHGEKKHEVVEEEVGLSTEQSEDRDMAPEPLEEVVPPALLQRVLAKRRARGAVTNGH